jgi:glyoxylase-like metal-dependent hydrolase (beta-lactamase superfamily II)
VTPAASAAEIHLGAARVTAVLDAEGVFPAPVTEAFPDAGSRLLERAQVLDPLPPVPPGAWWLVFRAYVVEVADRVVLVDTGAASDTALRPAWGPGPEGHLVHRLVDQAGVAARDVTDIVLTHLHADHAAGSVDAAGRPAFPNARYLVQDTEVAGLPRDTVMRTGLVEPLQERDQLVRCAGERELVTAAGVSVRVVPTPGHTAGHQSVVVTAGDETVVLAGDVFVHAAQVLGPELRYVHEEDPEAAVRTRARLLEELTERRGRLGTAHLRSAYLPFPLRP